MSIRVVSLRSDSPCQAEPGETVVVIDRTSKLGNPFHMEARTQQERERVIQRYRGFLNADISNKGVMYKEIMKIVDLMDKGVSVALACHCKPLPCHGDLIKSAAEILLTQNFRIRARFHKDGTVPQQEATIFVFGSNEAGRHGMGAAKIAKEKYGAVPGQGDGLMGRCFGISTKDQFLQTRPLEEMDFDVGNFCAFAKLHPCLNFFVTRVGCGLAGNDDADMAKLFLRLAQMTGHDMKNCSFAEEWKPFLIKQ